MTDLKKSEISETSTVEIPPEYWFTQDPKIWIYDIPYSDGSRAFGVDGGPISIYIVDHKKWFQKNVLKELKNTSESLN